MEKKEIRKIIRERKKQLSLETRTTISMKIAERACELLKEEEATDVYKRQVVLLLILT